MLLFLFTLNVKWQNSLQLKGVASDCVGEMLRGHVTVLNSHRYTLFLSLHVVAWSLLLPKPSARPAGLNVSRLNEIDHVK